MNEWKDRVHAIVYGDTFNWFIAAVIVFNAVLIGIDTYPISETAHHWLVLLETACLAIFIIEIALKFTFSHTKVGYFKDGWNIFDIIVVGGALIPAAGGFAPVLRVLRVFRVLRLVKVLPELRLIISVLYRSVASMAYIAVLMIIVFYIYAVLAVNFFGGAQPDNYGTLHEALFSLFRSMTAEDWTDLRYEGLTEGASWFWVTIFHVSWILISTFIILNLIVGAIINNYHEVQQTEKRQNASIADREERIILLMVELKQLLQDCNLPGRLDGGLTNRSIDQAVAASHEAGETEDR